MNTKEIADSLAEYRDCNGRTLSVGDRVVVFGIKSNVVGFRDRRVLVKGVFWQAMTTTAVAPEWLRKMKVK